MLKSINKSIHHGYKHKKYRIKIDALNKEFNFSKS